MALPIDELINIIFPAASNESDTNVPSSPISTNTTTDSTSQPPSQPQSTPCNEKVIKCRIKRIFNNCPKPDGWYGMFAAIDGQPDIRLSGITHLNLANGMKIEVTVTEDRKGSKPDQLAYVWSTITIVTKTIIGMINYLRALPGVSMAVAQKVVNKFGDKSLDEIENDINKVKTKCSLTDKQANALHDGVVNGNAINQINRQIPELTTNQINYCTDRLEIPLEKLIDTVKNDPYILCKIPSVSFATADTIALRFGIDPKSNYRIACGTKYLINQNKDDLYVNLSRNEEFFPLYKKLVDLLHIPDLDSMSYCNKLIDISNDDACPITIVQYQNETHLYMRNIRKAVESIVFHLTSRNPGVYSANDPILNFISDYEAEVSRRYHRIINLNDEQKMAVQNALTNPVSIVTGGPGRGKTLTIDCIATAWYSLRPDIKISNVILLAPTGKAANKLDTMTNHVFSQHCMTVDKLICKIRYRNKKSHNTDLEITSKSLVIIDESSMLDVRKAAELLEVCAGATICFVGDIDQLPPIETGNFFKDTIMSGRIPTTVLVTPMRNGGTILANAEKVNDNDPDLTYNFTDMPLLDFPIDDPSTKDAIVDQYFSEIQKLPNQDRSQLALLCPIKKGETGTIKLNIDIQNKIIPLNPMAIMSFDKRRGRNVYNTKGFEIPNHLYGNSINYTRFRIGDTVVNTENNNFIQVIKYSNDDWFNGDPLELDMGITNGDCGTIIQYVPATQEDHEFIIVQLFDGRFVELDASAGDFDKFELGYALTVHKAQGSEYHTVIYVSPAQMRTLTNIGFANKNIVYTAITRAQKRVVIIGSKDGLDASILCSVRNGNTKLAEMIRNA